MLHRARWNSSVRLSVTSMYRGHIGWNTSKIISWLISQASFSLLIRTSHIYSYSKEDTRDFGWNRCEVDKTRRRCLIFATLFLSHTWVLCSIEYRISSIKTQVSSLKTRVSSIKTRVSSFNWITRKHRIRPFLIFESRVLILETRDSNFSNPPHTSHTFVHPMLKRHRKFIF